MSSSGQVTVYVTIGNSDDKLTQRQWSQFCEHLDWVLAARNYVVQDRPLPGWEARPSWAAGGNEFKRIGDWYSLPDLPYQNRCVAGRVPADLVDRLRGQLAVLAGWYWQDSIALAVVDQAELVQAAW